MLDPPQILHEEAAELAFGPRVVVRVVPLRHPERGRVCAARHRLMLATEKQRLGDCPELAKEGKLS